MHLHYKQVHGLDNVKNETDRNGNKLVEVSKDKCTKMYEEAEESGVEIVQKSFKCCHCGREYNNETAKYKHEMIHIDSRYKCGNFQVVQKDEVQLQEHVEKCTEGVKRTFLCDLQIK